MEIRIQAIHFDATSQLQAFIQKKVSKLEQYFDGIIKAEVTLKVVKPETSNNKQVGIKLLIRNGEVVDEPYVKLPCEWNSEPVKVEPGHYFVVGDNRSMNKRNHRHGQLLARRIVGVPSW